MEKLKGIVRAATDPKEWNQQIQIGFTLEADPTKWYNISGEEAELKRTKDTLLKKGNEIEFEFDNGKIDQSKIKVISEGKGSWEDEIVNFETLLTAGHKKAEEDKLHLSMRSKVEKDENGKLMIDIENKFAFFKGIVIITNDEGKEIQRFEGHGDATAENVTGEFIKPHFIRMAETRAYVRALRWYTNNAKCAEEEKSNSDAEKEDEADY